MTKMNNENDKLNNKSNNTRRAMLTLPSLVINVESSIRQSRWSRDSKKELNRVPNFQNFFITQQTFIKIVMVDS